MIFTKKKIIISIVSLILLIGGSYYFFFYKKSDSVDSISPDVFYDVSTGSLLSSINVLGETNLLNEQKLKFNLVGTVKNIYVSEGDIVKTGDVLAELDKGELNNELKDAYIRFENTKLNLDKSLSKFGYEDKIKFEIEIENKKRKLESLKYDINNNFLLDTEKINLQDKEVEKLYLELNKKKNEISIEKNKIEKDFLISKNQYDYKVSTYDSDKWLIEKSISDEKKLLDEKIKQYDRLLESTHEQIYNDITDFDNTLRSINDILLIDNDYNIDFDLESTRSIYFSAKNSIYKNHAEISYWEVKGNYEKLLKQYKLIVDYKNIDNLVLLLELEKKIYESFYSLGDNISKGAVNSIISIDFTQSDISSIQSTGTNLRNSGTSGKKSIDENIDKLNNIDSIENLTQKSQISISKLTEDLSQLKLNLDKLKIENDGNTVNLPYKVKDLEFSYNTIESSYNKAVRDLEDMKYKISLSQKDKENEIKLAELDYEISFLDYEKRYKSNNLPEEIILLQNELKQAENNIDNVNKKIENYEIKAPFDGVIDSLNLKIGDNLSTNSPDDKYINLINPNIIEVKIKLDQVDIVKIKKGMLAEVKFDSYPDTIFSGSISFIDSKPTDDNGVKKFLVKMMIDKGELNIFSGMTANVEIIFEKIDDCILVPSMSVELDTEKGTNYVTVLVDGKKEKRTVEIGLTNDSMTQILSGVNVGEQILEVNFAANSFETTDFNGPQYYGP